MLTAPSFGQAYVDITSDVGTFQPVTLGENVSLETDNTSGNDTVMDFNAGEDILDLEFASTDFAGLAGVTAADLSTSNVSFRE